jgi:hypothetical protein
MKSTAFDQFAGLCAILAGVAGVAYALAFLLIPNAVLIALFLMLGGLFSSAALVGLYQHLRETDAAFAVWALALGLLGTAGATIHGGYDLANAINPPAANVLADANLPFALDPRGLLTFGISGLALGVASWLMSRGTRFPRNLAYLGYLLAVLLVVIYLVRLIILDPNASPLIKVALALTGVLVNPAWYVWLGLQLRGARQPASAPAAARV